MSRTDMILFYSEYNVTILGESNFTFPREIEPREKYSSYPSISLKIFYFKLSFTSKGVAASVYD